MDRLKSDYVTTITGSGTARAGALLDKLKLDKQNIAMIAEKLESNGFSATLVIPEIIEGTRITYSSQELAIRDTYLRLDKLYRLTNYMSLLLDSNIATLSSDIKILEDEIIALEKSLDNYGFLLSDGGSYDYAYLESFNDTRNKAALEFKVPDRAGMVFEDFDDTFVDSLEGMVSIAPPSLVDYGFSLAMMQNNCGGYITSDTGIQNAANLLPNAGWRVSIESPKPITSTLPEFSAIYANSSGLNGAQFIVEAMFEEPSPIDHIKINQFADLSMEVYQIEVFNSLEEDNSTFLLEAPIQLNQQRTIFISPQTVAKAKIYLRQDTFFVQSETSFKTEIQTKQILSEVEIIKKQRRRTRSILDLLKLNIGLGSGINVDIALGRASNLGTFDSIWQTTTIMGNSVNVHFKTNNTVSNSNNISTSVLSIIHNALNDSSMGEIIDSDISIQKSIFGFIRSLFDKSFSLIKIKVPKIQTVQIPIQVPVTNSKYKYSLGLKSIQFGLTDKNLKGVYVSTPIPSPGDIGELRMKVGDLDYRFSNTDKDLPLATFTEYSVTNVSRPAKESDWIPIIPVNKTEAVREILIPDDIGNNILRFPASLMFGITLYKNGYLTDIPVIDYLIKSADKQSVIGIKLPQGFASPTDYVIVEYTPAVDRTTVNFQEAGFELPPLMSAYDSSGAGESFSSVSGDMILTLSNHPFIDPNQVDDSTYDEDLGLNPYNPIVIRFEDGTLAINLTNYLGGTQSLLNPDADSIQYIHSGNTLIFNKTISQKFRVFYNYLPSNVRFRIAMRTVSDQFVSPKVDWVQMKCKTRKPDVRK